MSVRSGSISDIRASRVPNVRYGWKGDIDELRWGTDNRAMADHEDEAAPQIEHAVEEVWSGDTLEQRYNFLDYHFEHEGAYLRGRAYLDEIESVTLFGPFRARGSIARIEADEAERAALAYLERRYRTVNRL